MVEVILRDRRPPVLTPSALPCLRALPTINITEGCALGCTYCYIQGYSHYPGPQRVVLFANTPELLRDELRRKRRRPPRVYFSPSSDAFQYPPQVQDVSLHTMQVLLDAGVEIAFLTKGFVKPPFLALFATQPHRIFAQIGITTLDRRLWRAFEPRTAPPEMRINTIRGLVAAGIHTTARLDPLIPNLTDCEESLVPLLAALHDAGVRELSASYLFLRPAFAARLTARLNATVPDAMSGTWGYQSFDGGVSGGHMLGTDERGRRFERLRELANAAGLRVRLCRCKNPDLADAPCEIAGPADAGDAATLDRRMPQRKLDFGDD